jgi:hypothetical protein
VLVAPESHDANLWKSARNLEGVSVAPVADLNALSILMPRGIVMTKGAIEAFRKSAAAVTLKRAGAATLKRTASKPKSAMSNKPGAKKPAARKPAAKSAAPKTRKA